MSRLQGLTTGSVTRLAGADRYATSAAVATATSSPGARVAYLVDGSGFADALAAASPAALQRGPVLLTRTGSVPGPVAAALTTLKPRRIVGLGGSAVVSDGVLDSVRGLTRRGKATHLGTSPAGAHRCLVTTAGGVECWGENLEGQLGNGTRSGSAVPVPVSGLADVTAVGNGFHHTCALSAGEVWCWGDNGLGQLGRAPGQPSTVPVRVAGLGTVTALAVGTEFTCALGDDKTVRCWGDNLAGQLGFPATIEPHAAPRAVPGLEADVVQVTAGGSFACAILGNGSVRCWGDNWKGQSGADPAVADVVPATTVALSGPAASVGLGNSHACAVLSAGGVRCWGYGNDGRLGDGTLTSSWVPVTPRRARLCDRRARHGRRHVSVRRRHPGLLGSRVGRVVRTRRHGPGPAHRTAAAGLGDGRAGARRLHDVPARCRRCRALPGNHRTVRVADSARRDGAHPHPGHRVLTRTSRVGCSGGCRGSHLSTRLGSTRP